MTTSKVRTILQENNYVEKERRLTVLVFFKLLDLVSTMIKGMCLGHSSYPLHYISMHVCPCALQGHSTLMATLKITCNASKPDLQCL